MKKIININIIVLICFLSTLNAELTRKELFIQKLKALKVEKNNINNNNIKKDEILKLFENKIKQNKKIKQKKIQYKSFIKGEIGYLAINIKKEEFFENIKMIFSKNEIKKMDITQDFYIIEKEKLNLLNSFSKEFIINLIETNNSIILKIKLNIINYDNNNVFIDKKKNIKIFINYLKKNIKA